MIVDETIIYYDQTEDTILEITGGKGVVVVKENNYIIYNNQFYKIVNTRNILNLDNDKLLCIAYLIKVEPTEEFSKILHDHLIDYI